MWKAIAAAAKASGARSARLDQARADRALTHDGRAGTPQTYMHAAAAAARPGALARLALSGAIDGGQLAAGDQIAGIYAAIAADVTVRTASLETRIDAGQRGGGAAFETFAERRRHLAYSEWRRGLGGDAGLVLDVVARDVGLTAAATTHGMHKRRAKRIIVEALDGWIEAMTGARPARA